MAVVAASSNSSGISDVSRGFSKYQSATGDNVISGKSLSIAKGSSNSTPANLAEQSTTPRGLCSQDQGEMLRSYRSHR